MVEGTQLSALENRITELEKENLLLQEKAAFLTCKFYGRSTEQTSSLEIEGQMSFFDEAETEADPKAAEPDMKDAASYRRRRFPGQKEELLQDIPHEKKLCTLAEEGRFRPAVPRLFLWERNSSGRKSKSSLQRYVSLTITMKHSNAGTVVRTGGHIWRSHPCPVWSSGTLMRLLPLLSGSSIRSVNWPYRCTVRKTNGKILV